MKSSNERIPIKSALLWIVLATLLISGSTGLGIFYYLNLKKQHRQDDAYHVIAIVQAGPYKGTLRTLYFAELLELSIDKPKNLYEIDLEQETKRLLASPLIQSATITRMKPGTLVIDYVPRFPVAFLGDFTNTAIDAKGVLIPFKPFFSPKKLPVIYVGGLGDEIRWGISIEEIKGTFPITLFLNFESMCKTEGITLKMLDLVNAQDPNIGKREIVANIEEGLVNWSLRLTYEDFDQGLARFKVLRSFFNQTNEEPLDKVVDLRLPRAAFVTVKDKGH